MRWIVTGVALAVVAMIGTDVARACGGCCKGGGSGCPSCPQSSGPAGPAAPAPGPAACPNCPRAEANFGGVRSPGRDAGYPASPAGYAPPVGNPPPPGVTHSTSYLAAPRPGQTTSRYDRPAR